MWQEILASSWWEPGSADILDVGDVTAILVFITGVVAAWTGLTRWLTKQIRGVVRDVVQEYTMPIQPGANGGNSLPDMVREVKELKTTIDAIEENLTDTRTVFLEYLAREASDRLKE